MQKIVLENKSVLNVVTKKTAFKVGWIFLPGGPGMGPEYFIDLIQKLDLSYSACVLDLHTPTIINHDTDAQIISKWKTDLIQASKIFEQSIIIGHSFGGMLCLETPDLAFTSKKTIILNASPDLSYKKCYSDAFEKIGTMEMSILSDTFASDPTPLNLKNLFISWAPFFFNNAVGLHELSLLELNSYNPSGFKVGMNSFLNQYHSTWNTNFNRLLILGGEEDKITPVKLFHSIKDFDGVQKIVIPNASHFPWVENLHSFRLTLRQIEEML
jgi:pimeloyl-ACP methyl ester carboxylesterase